LGAHTATHKGYNLGVRQSPTKGPTIFAHRVVEFQQFQPHQLRIESMIYEFRYEPSCDPGVEAVQRATKDMSQSAFGWQQVFIGPIARLGACRHDLQEGGRS
jgi:hypothetical protein